MSAGRQSMEDRKMDGLLERVCWIAAYCASLAGQRASEGQSLGALCNCASVGCDLHRLISDNDARNQATNDARLAVEAMRGVK
jgi:hypothetical protein